MSRLATICIPNYNCASYIQEALDSAASQTVRDVDIVVVDNQSTDTSWEIIRRFSEGRRNVQIARNDRNVGMVANWNRCLEYVKTPFAVWLSSDDALEPTFLERLLALHARQPLSYVACEHQTIDERGVFVEDHADFYEATGIIPGEQEVRIQLVGWHTLPSCMLIRTDLLRECGGFSLQYDWCFDVDAMIALALRGDVGYVRDRLCRYRVHAGMSQNFMASARLGVIEKYRLKVNHLRALRQDPNLAPGLDRDEMERGILRNVTNLSLSYARKMVVAGNFDNAIRYLHLGRSFDSDVLDGHPATAVILHYCQARLQPTNEDFQRRLNQGSDRGGSPPYPLPTGAIGVITQ